MNNEMKISEMVEQKVVHHRSSHFLASSDVTSPMDLLHLFCFFFTFCLSGAHEQQAAIAVPVSVTHEIIYEQHLSMR